MAILESLSPSLDDYDKINKSLQKNLGISKITSAILINRGITQPKDAKDFLYPSMDLLFDPYCLKGMDRAVKRIREAISSKEHITVYGDYDVDGITSVTILQDFLTHMGCETDIYIPSRSNEGYGINMKAIDTIFSRGTRLIISVDCGITSIKEVEYIKSHKMDIIITDHHQAGRELPGADAIINPALDSKLHQKHPLAGVGVAAKLIQALGDIKSLDKYLDLIALGTVADIVPLIGDNRVFVSQGLLKMNKNPSLGLEALIRVSGNQGMEINTGRIAFGLAPRLNAAGRIDDPLKSFQLLSAKKSNQATPIAEHLELQNKIRQKIESHIIKDAEDMIGSFIDLSTDRVIVLAKEGWEPGVIGIAASKIVEKYRRPCLLISIKDDLGVGSARGIRGFNLYEALNQQVGLFDKFGGHEMAAGFSIKKENIERLQKELLLYCDRLIDDSMMVPRYAYDAELMAIDVNHDLVNELKLLEPFGIGNPSPSFLIQNAKLEENRKVGSDGKHLKMTIEFGQRLWDGIAFNMGPSSEPLKAAGNLIMIGALEANNWRGVSKIQFNIKHMDIQDRQDWLDLLSFFHRKYFDAFFSDFMYNEHCEGNDPPKLQGDLPPKSLEDISSELKKTRLGSMVLAGTYKSAQLLMKYFEDKNLLDRIIFGYGRVHQWQGLGMNRVIIAPTYNDIDFSAYKSIYIFKEETPDRFINKALAAGKAVYEIAPLEGLPSPFTKPKNEYKLARQDFVLLYKWIQSQARGKTIWKDWADFEERYKSSVQRDINSFKLMLILKVFEELDFLKVESDNKYVKIKTSKDPLHRKLDESRLFTYYNQWIQGDK